MKINLDMDGTFVNLYGVNDWLSYLIAENVFPYVAAKPLINLSVFARLLNKLQKKGYEINIISWCSKNGTTQYNQAVIEAKKKWLRKHLPSVKFDNLYIVPYGTSKNLFNSGMDILFDDEARNRDEWTGTAYTQDEIFEILRELAA